MIDSPRVVVEIESAREWSVTGPSDRESFYADLCALKVWPSIEQLLKRLPLGEHGPMRFECLNVQRSTQGSEVALRWRQRCEGICMRNWPCGLVNVELASESAVANAQRSAFTASSRVAYRGSR